MEFFTHKTKINFMRQKWWAFTFSAVVILGSALAILTKGLNLGLDFSGGLQLELAYNQQSPGCATIRTELRRAGLEAVVYSYGSAQSVVVKLKPDHHFSQEQLIKKVTETLPSASLHKVDMIGPQFGKSMVVSCVLAVIAALLGIMIYVAFRFEYRFAISAAVSLIHDPLLILGVFSIFNIEFDLIAMAAILTVIGYSLNDTIVVYDRIRENFRKHHNSGAEEILNLSINQTLSRTIMISSLTFAVVSALLIFGGPMLHGFSLAMLLGIVIGTYSSIYIAGSLALVFGLERKHLIPKTIVKEEGLLTN